jgi:predicted DsbA family dithiol-disulfide isomerase
MLMARLEVYADIVCPFTHVGLRRLHDMRAARGSTAGLQVRAWPLELVNGAPVAADLVAREIEGLRAEVAPDLFGGFRAATFPRTSMPAFGLAAAAYELDESVGEAVSLALRDAVFEKGRDVGETDTLRAIADSFGITPLDTAATDAAVRRDWERGKARGVQGSPHFFAGGRDWFCPTLDIHHEGDAFEVRFDVDAMRDFYETALA